MPKEAKFMLERRAHRLAQKDNNKSDEEKIKWEKFLNKILLDTEQLGQENRRKRNELYGMKG